MRYQLILIALFTLIISACGTKTDRVVESTYPNGKEKLVRYYTSNESHDLVKEEAWYANGQKEMEGEFKEKQRHGAWIYWYQNGNVWSEGEFKNGQAHGWRKVYYENGQLRYEGKFDNGKQIGEWTYYDENGNVTGTANY